MKKKIKVWFITILSCFIFMEGQFTYTVYGMSYILQINYKYKNDCYEVKSDKIDSSKNDKSSFEESSILEVVYSSEIEEGTEIRIPCTGDVIDGKSVDVIGIGSNDNSAIDRVLYSVDGTFEMPAANLEIEIILEDSDE